jgi:envelope integrity protein B
LRRPVSYALAAISSVGLLLSAVQAQAAALESHRAIYEIGLARTSPGGMVAARGRTVIEFRDACIGWSTTQRFVADMTNAQGDPARTDFIATTWESKDERAMRFTLKNSIDGKTSQHFAGTATLAASGRGTVEMSVPHGRNFPLPVGVMLPTAHTLQVLAAAQAGQSSIHELVFQGGDKTNLYDATAIIGRQATPAEMEEDHDADKDGLLKGQTARSILISYFPYGSRGTAPDYEVAYRLYSNGVVSSMSLIYSHFTLRASLARLEKLPPDCRNAQ